MRLSFTYDKRKVMQALRYHFVWQPEIRVLLITIVVFDIISAILYYMNKIRPEPFVLGSAIWFFFLISFWFILPYSIYKKSSTFKESFKITLMDGYVMLQNPNGQVEWSWSQFTKFLESPDFFHLYFSAKSFFLIPKDGMSDDIKTELRLLFNSRIRKM